MSHGRNTFIGKLDKLWAETCVRVVAAAPVLAEDATALEGGGKAAPDLWEGGEGAAADVAAGLSVALSDRDALWIAVCLSAGGKEAGSERRRV